MIESDSPIYQTLLGTLFTWGMTAAGAGLVVVISGTQRVLLDSSLGFAGGVMTAASYWSLLAPAIEMAEDSNEYGDFAFLPAAVGFLLGSLFVYITDVLITTYGLHSAGVMLGFWLLTLFSRDMACWLSRFQAGSELSASISCSTNPCDESAVAATADMRTNTD